MAFASARLRRPRFPLTGAAMARPSSACGSTANRHDLWLERLAAGTEHEFALNRLAYATNESNLTLACDPAVSLAGTSGGTQPST
jgi:hypothetical protein